MIGKIKHFLKARTRKSSPPIYSLLGEETGVYELVKNFYNTMENSPKAKECLNVHELDTNNKIPDLVKKKLFMFLCGWFGGPNLFIESYGHPRMRARHIHVKIGEKEKEQWMFCMETALKMHTKKIKKKNYTLIYNSFLALSNRIQNQ